MKRFVTLLIVPLFIALLASCSESTSSSTNGDGNTTSATPAEDTDPETTPIEEQPTDVALASCGFEVGASAFEGIVIGEQNGNCIVMETEDRAACRVGNSYVNCMDWLQASAACEAGTSPGLDWYLPSDIELRWIWDQRGEETSAVSANGICLQDSGNCLAQSNSTPRRFPYYYWTSVMVSDSQYLAMARGTIEGAGRPAIDRHSVRCVKQVAVP